MSMIRSANAGDIPQIVDLYCRVFGGGPSDVGQTLTPFLQNVMLRSPWQDNDLRSLACEGPNGELLGYLGIFYRPMQLDGEPIRAAISNLFMVEPSSRSGLAALQLLQAFFRGPQDLSIAEGNDSSRRLWERFGGRTSLLYSMNWVRPLRSLRYVTSQLPVGSAFASIVSLGRPLLSAADALIARMPPNRLHRPAKGIFEERLDTAGHLAGLEQLTRGRRLQPVYDEKSLDWLMQIFEAKSVSGTLERVLVRDEGGRILGWYIYYAKAGEVAKVLQMAAEPESVSDVPAQPVSAAGGPGQEIGAVG
jgi:hypothetical protein